MTSFSSGTSQTVEAQSGITASTNQSQGNGVLNPGLNEISICANDSDTVTLPTAVGGLRCTIVNNGAKTLQIFPASGDNLGHGVNLAENLKLNQSVVFVCYDATNWVIIAATTSLHYGMLRDSSNTDAFIINDAGGDVHAYHSNGIVAGGSSGFSFDVGGAGTSHAIASIADGAASGVDIAVTTSTSHNLAVGAIVSQTNLADSAYVGHFIVKAIISDTVYEVAAVYTATGTGTMDEAATLTLDAGGTGIYQLEFFCDATPANNNDVFDFNLYIAAVAQATSQARVKLGTAGDYQNSGAMQFQNLVAGNKISWSIANTSGAGNVTIRNLQLLVTKL